MYDGFGDLPCNAECAERTCPRNIFGRCHDNATCEKQEKENRGEGNLEQGGNPMSVNEHETHAAVVAEMRKSDNEDICPWWADGGDCANCPMGGGKNCPFDKFAYRAEAAHKREVEKLQREYDECVRDYNNAQRSRSFAESRLRELKKSIASIALKLREHADNNDDEAMDPDDIYAHEAKAVRNFADEIDMTLDCETSCSTGLRDIFNAAKLREAVVYLVENENTLFEAKLSIGELQLLHLIVNKARAALAEPARNCDVYDNESCRMAYHLHGDGIMTMQAFADWLFAPANEKGENDGRK